MKNLLKMLKMVKGSYPRIFLIILSSVIFGALNAFWPIALRWIINNGSQILSGKSQGQVLKYLAVFILVSVAVALLMGIFDGLTNYLGEVTFYFVFNKITKKVFERSQSLTHSYYEENSAGAILEKINGGIGGFGQWVLSLSYSLIEPLVTIIYAVVIISLVSPIAGLLVIMCAIYYIIKFSRTRAIANPIYEKTRKYQEKTFSTWNEGYSNFSTIRAMSAESIFKDKFNNSADKVLKNQRKEMRIWVFSMSERSFVTRLTLFLIIAYLLFSLWQRKINTGDIVLVSIFVLQINSNLYGLSRFISNSAESNIKAGRLIDFLEKTPVIKDEKGSIKLKRLDSIEFKNVSFEYPNSKKGAISNISFKIDAGKSVALVGPSGTGKSTITKLILRFYEPTSGKILINGEDISNFKQDSIRKNMAIVMQDVALFNTTVKENLAIASDKVSEQEIQKAAKMANADEFITQLDKGYNTLVGERGIKLSGGQKQRIAITRAILKNPNMIILDEATSALDSESEVKVQDALKNLLYHKMSLIIAHRLSTVRHVDEIIVLKNGRVYERGTHTNLLRKKGLYAKLFNIQSKTGKIDL